MKSVLRWEIPIDDQDHVVHYSGNVTGTVATVLGVLLGVGKMEFWTFNNLEPSDEGYIPATDHTYRVFGTGHPVPENYWLVGTAPRNAGLVFHLFERIEP